MNKRIEELRMFARHITFARPDDASGLTSALAALTEACDGWEKAEEKYEVTKYNCLLATKQLAEEARLLERARTLANLVSEDDSRLLITRADQFLSDLDSRSAT